MATSFDTPRAAKRLKGLGFDEAQAEGVADILRENREVDLSHLATTADLDALRLAASGEPHTEAGLGPDDPPRP